MSTGRSTENLQNVLSELNQEADLIHNEIQASGAINYPSPEVQKMSSQDRREIGKYLCKHTGLDYSSSVRVIKQLGMVYDDNRDVYLVTDLLIDKEELGNSFSYISHETGHRYGRKLIQDRLLPFKEGREVDKDDYNELVDYFISENFAERVKLALGERFGMDVEYDEKFLEDTPSGYVQRDRLGPEKYVDGRRDENLNRLLEWVDERIKDLST